MKHTKKRKYNNLSVLLFILIPFFIGGCKSNNVASRFGNVPGNVVAYSPKSSGIYLGSPSIVKLPNGDYLESHDFFGPKTDVDSIHVYYSSDKGKTWKFRSKIDDAFWAGMFVVGQDVYMLGVEGSTRNLMITKSSDYGKTWAKKSILRKGRFHGSSTPVIFHNGRIYKGYDHLGVEDKKKPWMADNKSFIMSAPAGSDLMNPENWTYTHEIAKPAEMDGTGWLETNAVLRNDGKIAGVTRVANKSGLIAGYYELKTDSEIDMATVGYIDFIGGATKFNVMWDSKTQKYWALTNYPPDIFRTPKMRAGGMRSVLSLISSTDLKNWEVNSIELVSDNVEKHGFQYVDWLFDGDDIIYLSRTGYFDGTEEADNAHNSNFMTFHRIKNYAKIKVLDKHQYLLKKTGEQ